jgi:transposase-like protein
VSVLTKPYFHDEAAAFAKLESVLWPRGPVCPKCGNAEKIYVLDGVRSKASKKNPEGIVRHGLKKCGKCRQQFTVRVGTVFESSHIPLHKWFQAVHLMCCSKKGISSHQLHRILEITYEAAWFMSHRIREAMRSGSLAPPMGGAGNVVEIDETLIGKTADAPKGRRKPNKRVRGSVNKNIVLSLVERGGEVRSFHVEGHAAADLVPIINANVAREAQVMTDEASWYRHLNDADKDGVVPFASHETVNHSVKEYARKEEGRPTIHTNTIEGYFSVFKRGMRGTYQHCSEKHLHRYLAEFDFRYNARSALGIEDAERTERALKGISGKRLTYRVS